MTRPSRYSSLGILSRHAVSSLVGTLLVAVLVALAVFAAAVTPRLLARMGTEELHHAVSATPPILRDLRGTGRIGIPIGLAGTPADRLVAPTDAALASTRDDFGDMFRGMTGAPRWVARTPSSDAALPPTAGSARFVLKLAVDPAWAEGVRFVAGESPTPWTGDEDSTDPQPAIEIALSADTAEELGVSAGDELAYGRLTLNVAALYEPLRPDDGYWTHFADLTTPTVEQEPGSPPSVHASAYVHPAALGGLAPSLTAGSLLAWMPVDASRVTWADAAATATQARAALASDVALPYGGTLALSSAFPDALDDAIARTMTVTALLALAVSGLFGVLLAAFALGIGTITKRRRPALALAGARGAGTIQLRGAMALEGLVVAVPATVIGIAAARFVAPDPVGPEGWVLPVAVGVTVPVLFALLTETHGPAETRDDLRVRGSRTRMIAELAVVGVAALALAMLARRGLGPAVPSIGIDPLTVLTPVLVAAALCIGALRLYPIPLSLILRRVRRGDSAVSLLGAARAMRAPALGFAASFALVLGVSVVVFSSVLGSTLRAAVVDGAQNQVGADLRVSAPDLGAAVRTAVDEVPGVRAVAALSPITGVRIASGDVRTTVTLIVTDTRALHEVRGDIPFSEAGGRGIPLVVSADISGRILPGPRIAGADVVVAGSLPADALPVITGPWAIVDTRYADALGRTELVADSLLVGIRSDADADAVMQRIDDVVTSQQDEGVRGAVSVLSTRQILDRARSSPLARGLDAALPAASVAALVLTLLSVGIATVAATTARGRSIAVLRVLGADARQQRGLLLWELLPPIAASLIVGAAVGFALPFALSRLVDLRPFVGGRSVPETSIDPGTLLVAIGAVVVFAAAAGAVAFAVARRGALATTLKMGER